MAFGQPVRPSFSAQAPYLEQPTAALVAVIFRDPWLNKTCSLGGAGDVPLDRGQPLNNV